MLTTLTMKRQVAGRGWPVILMVWTGGTLAGLVSGALLARTTAVLVMILLFGLGSGTAGGGMGALATGLIVGPGIAGLPLGLLQAAVLTPLLEHLGWRRRHMVAWILLTGLGWLVGVGALAQGAAGPGTTVLSAWPALVPGIALGLGQGLVLAALPGPDPTGERGRRFALWVGGSALGWPAPALIAGARFADWFNPSLGGAELVGLGLQAGSAVVVLGVVTGLVLAALVTPIRDLPHSGLLLLGGLVAAGLQLGTIIQTGGLGGPLSTVHCLAWSPDSRTLAAVDEVLGHDPQILFWQAGRWDRAAQGPGIGSPRSCTGLAYSPDGQDLAYGAIGEAVRIWQTADLKQPPAVLTGSEQVDVLAYRPGTRQLAVLSGLRTVQLFDLAQPERDHVRFEAPGLTEALLYLADGRVATASSDWGLSVWQPEPGGATGTRLPASGGGALSNPRLAAAPGGDRLAGVSDTPGGNPILVWTLTPPQADPTTIAVAAQVASLAFSPDGQWLAAGSRQPAGGVHLFNLNAPATAPRVLPLAGAVMALAFSPDGRRLAGGTAQQGLWVWDTTRWEAPPQAVRR